MSNVQDPDGPVNPSQSDLADRFTVLLSAYFQTLDDLHDLRDRLDYIEAALRHIAERLSIDLPGLPDKKEGGN